MFFKKQLSVGRLNMFGTGRFGSPVGFFVTQIRVRFLAASSSTEQCHIVGKQSFTVSYLMSSLGLSSKDALSLSQKVQFESAEKPDSVISLFRSHGFNDTHIIKLVKSCPDILSCNPSKILLPKFNFFYSLGVSRTDLASFMSSGVKLLRMSLEKRIMPLHSFLKYVIGLDDIKIAEAIRRATWADNKDRLGRLAINIALLRQHKVPESFLLQLIIYRLGLLLQKPTQFEERVNGVIQMGMDPKKQSFCNALTVISGLSVRTREHKVKTFVKYGWSEDDFQLAFKKNPLCVFLSEKIICNKMNYLVNEMGVKASDIACSPTVLLYSMERRIIPRLSIVKVLELKGLLEKQVPISSILCSSNKIFIGRFVSQYVEDIPQLMNLLQGNMSLPEISSFISSHEKS
ncbi:transcription termination factor MTERF6, chloroplastic/mitochondrial-like [Impatiens glandulifera]|uniref:transcription termination factor MTERF6, chloroplastic/mitochondrial-like n=1 Tax=Impatiens glandulifera TaxID=253017 RepID=UPI001FB0622E|nr:transcription termination factor MTERF6, chloroplastic/mitochondrial-like [Impatiens glandulifera]